MNPVVEGVFLVALLVWLVERFVVWFATLYGP